MFFITTIIFLIIFGISFPFRYFIKTHYYSALRISQSTPWSCNASTGIFHKLISIVIGTWSYFAYSTKLHFVHFVHFPPSATRQCFGWPFGHCVLWYITVQKFGVGNIFWKKWILWFSTDILKNELTDVSHFPQNIKQHNCFQKQISILKLFLKDLVTLKTGVMMLKIQLCVTGINCILKYIKI